MRAAVLRELNAPLSVESVFPQSLGFGQVRVRMAVSGICGSQLHEIAGNKGNGKFLPHLMGHEGYGCVVEVGAGVTTVAVDDQVVLHWRPGSGIESGFSQYVDMNGSNITSGKVNTLAQIVNVSENRVTRVPPYVNPEFAALLGCGLSTALGIVENEIEVKPGMKVAVVGCGGVGLNVIQAAALMGAEVVGIDIQEKGDMVTAAGGAFSRDMIGNFDAVVDTTGRPPVIAKAFDMASEKLIIVGQPNPGESLTLNGALQFFDGSGKMVKATQGGKVRPDVDFPRYYRLENKLKTLVSHRFPLDEINEAFDTLRSGRASRIMVWL